MTVLRNVDAVTIPVPDLDTGLRCYVHGLGHRLLWRNDAVGQAGLALPDSETEVVLTTTLPYEPTWLVDDVLVAVQEFRSVGGELVSGPEEVPVGRVAVVVDPFGNRLVLLDLSEGRYVTDDDGTVTGVRR
ncbi:VOC family protein [Cellulomonas sp. Leaf334]|uniref:VOC family protein n=1 Tax=Cellulomonas sp. Leaf334 TaxID=1736339 RepID=UPI0006F31E52|nr:VOC family protein [Cellulomonas sp. Leaf334]KQR16092.1 hypothetical protein ASF78_01245 [Cellulomonas sp. Leaf334]